MTEEERAYKEHFRLGFKSLSEREQAEMLITGNVEIINRLTPGYRAPYIFPSLWKLYITISKDVFRKYFNPDAYLQKKNLRHNLMPQSDGDWIEPMGDGTYKHLIQERGKIIYETTYANREKLTDALIREIYSSRGLR